MIHKAEWEFFSCKLNSDKSWNKPCEWGIPIFKSKKSSLLVLVQKSKHQIPNIKKVPCFYKRKKKLSSNYALIHVFPIQIFILRSHSLLIDPSIFGDKYIIILHSFVASLLATIIYLCIELSILNHFSVSSHIFIKKIIK